ncbi:MAG: hypothetical protein HY228_00455 [Candidatus Yonathbacteria bacterium]|nr:hypothetical protein [Candidatus Yonathbacteria bacterium]
METIFERQSGEREFISKLNEKAKKSLKEYSIKMDDFADYGEENIKKDKELVVHLKQKHKKENSSEEKEAKILADILEAIILEESELSNWLGENTSTIKASDYDDYVNGIDAIIEFEEETTTNHAALGIDATFSKDIHKKFNRIKKEIEDGVLAEAKYFSSSFIKGRHKQIPRLVIGADVKTIKELGELWLDKDSKTEGRKREVKKALEDHPLQFQILKQMILEAETFKEYAKKIGQVEIAGIYERLGNIIKNIYDNKKKQQTDTGLYDDMFGNIKDNLKSFE